MMAQRLPNLHPTKGDLHIGGTMGKKILISLSVVVLAAFGAACTKSEQANSNSNTSTAATSRPAPDNSEVTTSIDPSGVKTETRTFRNNPRVSKVVVTTRNGQRTVRVYSPSGEEKEVNDGGNALEATGDKIASAAGWTADKAEDAAGKTKEGAKTAADKTADAAKTVGEKTVEGAKTVGSKTASTAKTVGNKTVEGAKTVTKETQKAVKKIIP